MAVNKSNKQHDEIKNRIMISNKSNALHLSQMNIDIVMPDVFKLTNLVRLDLSYNNIVKLSPKIS